MSEPDATGRVDLVEALLMQVRDAGPDHASVDADIDPGFDVFGIPHGGYLTALVARSVLLGSGQPDVFTVTVHFLRRAAPGPMRLDLRRVGGSRRFSSWQVAAVQDGQVMMACLASVGDRTWLDGPAWTDAETWQPGGEALGPPAGHPDLPFPAPGVAVRFTQRIALSTSGFATGRRGDEAMVRCQVEADPVDQLVALVACDITPPAVWNVLGMQGWVPTVELTAHVRARPGPGPLTVEAGTHHVGGGFLEEDALVRDAGGRLVVQSRQLARWTQT